MFTFVFSPFQLTSEPSMKEPEEMDITSNETSSLVDHGGGTYESDNSIEYTELFTYNKEPVAKKRVYDKKHCCFFCNKYYSKLARHLEQCHQNETQVAVILSHPKKSPIRKAQFLAIMKRGDFCHNKEVYANNKGTLITRKRIKNTDDTSHLPCSHCFGLYKRKDLWRHVRKCKANSNEKTSENAQVAGRMLLPVSIDVEADFQQAILNTMVSGEIFDVIINDALILEYGKKCYQKCKSQPHQFNYVKQKMRELGRLLISMRTICKSALIHMKDCIDPTRFKNVISAVRLVCNMNDGGNVSKPSLGLKIGHSLKKIALLQRSQALQTEDNNLKKKASDFVKLYTSDWATEISASCLETLHTKTFNKPKRIPLAEDIKCLSNYLEQQGNLLKEEIDKTSGKLDTWQELNEVTLAQVVLFNRRRAGETQRIEISQYEEALCNKTEMQSDVASGLSSFEKKLALTLTRLEIRGKRGRKVPVLLTMKHKERIDCLLKHRHLMGVNPENTFLFPRSGDVLSCIRSCDVLRKFANKCGAKQPDLLSSTSLRKHIATISQILNLKNHELDSLAGFLGHDINVHRNYYRLPEDTIQVAKVGKILHELDKNRIANHKGKSLDEINIDDDEVIESDQNDSEGEQEENDNETPSVETYEENENTTEPTAKEKPRMKPRRSKTQSTKTPWGKEEKAAIDRTLAKYFTIAKLPGKHEIQDAQKKEPILQRRPWQQIKFYLKNIKKSPNFLS